MNKNKPKKHHVLSIGLLAASSLLGTITHAAAGETITLKSADLEVLLDQSFPQIISYSHLKTGAQIHGQSEKLTQFLLNEKLYTAKVNWMKGASSDKLATYKLTFPDADNLSMDAQISLDGSILTFKIKNIKEGKGFKLTSVEIPNHGMISVHSKQPGAEVSSAIINTDQSKKKDTFLKVTPQVKEEKRSAAYAIVNTNKLAATLVNNSAYDIDKDDRHAAPNANDAAIDKDYKGPVDKAIKLGNGRVRIAVGNKENQGNASLSSGQWTYRALNSKVTTDELWTKVIITGDRNGDQQIDWQDGAIAFRDIMDVHDKKGLTPQRVAQRIAFNFGSHAGEPFLRTLDNVKRVHYATDGLGQFVVLKGYQSEGHDSAHPDYAGNVGIRQGGVDELNFLIDTSAKWGAEIGVHLNCQEAYPEAKTFEDAMVFKDRRGWDWIDFSYIMNHRWDITSGAFEKRISDMKKELPGLDFIYMDVYWGDGWLAQEMARILDRNDIGITTEFPSMLEHASTWSHWSTDVTYGPDTRRGINSHIIRFIRNHEKDTYLRHPLLGHAELGDFETWQGRTDFNQFLGKLYSAALPSKFLQHHQILKWTEDEVLFSGDVKITKKGDSARQIFQKGVKVLDGDTYLLPWEPTKGTKLYHWSTEGGKSTWEIPANWKTKTVKLYELSHTGRTLVADLPVADGKITIEAKAKTPYVVYQTEAPALPKPNWGEGQPIKDPGFWDSSLANWKVEADKDVVSVETDKHVRTALVYKASKKPATVSQTITLEPGTYSASVWVEVDQKGRKASLTATPEGGKPSTTWTDCSPLENTVKNSHWNRTRTQIMRTVFDVPAGKDKVTLALKVDAGDSRVMFDNIRVQKTVRSEKEGYDYYQNFEHLDEGWFPFVKGPAGGVEDPRTHLSELHAPFTNKGWNGQQIDDTLGGNWSLKCHRERSSGKKGDTVLLYRTIPQSLRFEPGNKYEVSFDYQNVYSGEYEFVIGADENGESKELKTLPIDVAHETKRFKVTVEPKKGQELWIGLNRIKSESKHKDVDFVLDNLGVRKLK